MPTRPYLVLSNRECVPLEGPYRIEEHEGSWYLLGHHRALPFATQREARMELERGRLERDADARAAEALEGLPAEYEVVAGGS